jgi:hypothetical protein
VTSFLFFSFLLRWGPVLASSLFIHSWRTTRKLPDRSWKEACELAWQLPGNSSVHFECFSIYIYIPDMAKLRPNPLGKVKSVWNKKWGRCKYLMSETSWQEKKRQDHYVHAVEGLRWQWIMTHIYTSVSFQSPRKSRGSFPALSAPDDWFLFSDL